MKQVCVLLTLSKPIIFFEERGRKKGKGKKITIFFLSSSLSQHVPIFYEKRKFERSAD